MRFGLEQPEEGLGRGSPRRGRIARPGRSTRGAALAPFLLAPLVACGDAALPSDEAKARGETAADYPLAEADHFSGMDGAVDPATGAFGPRAFSPRAIQGRNAWMMWSGGNEAFWDWLARYGYGTIDLLKLLDSERRGTRFRDAGLVTEPGTRPPTAEETAQAHGVRYDRLVDAGGILPSAKVYGYSSGVIGLRLFPNPEFTADAASRFDAKRWYEDPEYASRPDTIRPFRVGMSCAFCHAAPHPLAPPADPEEPAYENLSGSIGNQFMRVRAVFGNVLDPTNFLYQVLDSQPPGTIDTSLVASDNINNPNTMNAVFGLTWRVERALRNPVEFLSSDSAVYPGLPPSVATFGVKKGLWDGVAGAAFDANPRAVPRVLLDGSDSVGAWTALARVYLNIGTYHQQWIRLHNPLLGFRPQQPFKIADCIAGSVYWQATANRVEPLSWYFLEATDPMPLAAAPGDAAKSRVRGSGRALDPEHALGRAVFAKGCIACHSSVQPGERGELEAALAGSALPADRSSLALRLDDLARLTRGDGRLPPSYATWAAAAVEREEFWTRNYLSTDARIPVTLTRTNSARAMATNALHGQMWEDFASNTYKGLDSVGRISYFDPLSRAEKSFLAPGGGPGYYRVPSLIGAWATAPFLHNNSLGRFDNDPSVAGRLAAYDDAIGKLLWPERRVLDPDPARQERLAADHGLIWRTSHDTYFEFQPHHLPSLLAGATGWPPLGARVFPWAPSLGFLVLGVLLLLSHWIVSGFERALARLPWLARHVMALRFWTIVALLAGAGGLAFLLHRVTPTLLFFEAMTESRLPWLRAQAWSLVLFPLGLAVLVVLPSIRAQHFRNSLSRVAGAACLLAAVVLALGFGRFLSGNGDGVRFGPLPKGIPVNLLANMDPHAPVDARLAAVRALLDFVKEWHGSDSDARPGRREFEERVAPLLLAVSKCPDFVMDRGHDYAFMRDLTDAERQALAELLLTF
jgi:hypothetical protein